MPRKRPCLLEPCPCAPVQSAPLVSLDLKRKLGRLGAPSPGGASHAQAHEQARPHERERPHEQEVRSEPAPYAPGDTHLEVDRERKERVAMLRALIAKKQAETSSRIAKERTPEPLPGELVETADGPLHRVARYLEPGHHHGRTPIVKSLGVSAKSLAALALDASLCDIDPRKFLFLDTETTGLSGGTGTLPFLIGMAWFEDESLCLEQLLLRKPGEEKPMLKRVAERMREASAIVTYNGKSFDWPLVRTRAVMNRVPLPPPVAHLDLLHAARRVFGPRLKAVKLTQMEANVLGLRREHDIDGAEIPPLFWDFVRGADGSTLTPVIEHNANDLVALAALVVVLAERWDGALPHHAPEDQLAVAKVAFRYGDHPRALARARSAADAGGDAKTTAAALVLGAKAARKTDDLRVEEAMLHEALTHALGDEREHVHLSLAKLYEHKHQDFERALHHLHQAGESETDEARTKRHTRLEAKRLRRS